MKTNLNKKTTECFPRNTKPPKNLWELINFFRKLDVQGNTAKFRGL